MVWANSMAGYVYLVAAVLLASCNQCSANDDSHPKMLRDQDTLSDDTPQLNDCLMSAVNSDDCGTVVAGCIWCAEPAYGLCVTPHAANRMGWMPFFTCNLEDSTEEMS